MFFRLFVPVITLAICAVLFYETFGFRQMANLDPAGPKVFPRILIGVIVVCSILEIVRFFREVPVRELKGAFGEVFQWISPHSDMARFNSSQRAIISIALSLIYPMAIIRVGYIISTCVFIILLALLFRARPWMAVLVGVVASVGTFFLFAEVLNIRVPAGAWFDIRSLLFG